LKISSKRSRSALFAAVHESGSGVLLLRIDVSGIGAKRAAASP